jgi:hypothetical protein
MEPRDRLGEASGTGESQSQAEIKREKRKSTTKVSLKRRCDRLVVVFSARGAASMALTAARGLLIR